MTGDDTENDGPTTREEQVEELQESQRQLDEAIEEFESYDIPDELISDDDEIDERDELENGVDFTELPEEEAEAHYDELDGIREEQAETFVEWLENVEYVDGVRSRNRGIDFTVGSIEIWPDSFDDDHLNSIRSSSVSMHNFTVEGMNGGQFINEAVIHLPPAREELEEDIESELDLGDRFAIHYGTRALGGMPAPNGVVTPHIQTTDAVRFDELQDVVKQVLNVYVEVYQEGAEAIKQQPEEYR